MSESYEGRVEGDIHNVFDQLADHNKTVPVVVEINGEKKVVGNATLSKRDGYVHADMNLKTDNESDVAELFKNGISGYSSDDSPLPTDEELDRAHVEALFEFEPHDHKPVQHRDGRSPWCNFCGLGENMHEPKNFMPHDRPAPEGRFGKPRSQFGMPTPPRDIHE